MHGQPTDAEWRSWLDEHGAAFWLFARQKSRSEMDAEDLMQESILEAAKRSREPGPPAAALVFATIQRRAIDRARRETRRVAREIAAAQLDPRSWFDTTVEDREQAQLIEQALLRLPEKFREVLTLKIWGGLTFAEIGEALGLSGNTAASRYRYALQELRQLTKEVFT